MGTYDKHHSIKWINFNVEAETMEVAYKSVFTHDDGTVLEKEEPIICRNKDFYRQMFNFPVDVQGFKDTPLGALITYLTEKTINAENPDFIVDEKFENFKKLDLEVGKEIIDYGSEEQEKI